MRARVCCENEVRVLLVSSTQLLFSHVYHRPSGKQMDEMIVCIHDDRYVHTFSFAITFALVSFKPEHCDRIDFERCSFSVPAMGNGIPLCEFDTMAKKAETKMYA